MATGPDLGPFQNLTAINFKQGEIGDLVTKDNFGRIYFLANDLSWTLLNAGPGLTLSDVCHDSDNNCLYAIRSVDIWKFDFADNTWAVFQTLSSASRGICSDVTTSGVAYLYQFSPTKQYESWVPGNTPSVLAATPASWSAPGGEHQRTTVWDSFNSRLITLTGRFTPGPALSGWITYVTSGGSTGELFNLPVTYDGVPFTVRGCAVDPTNGKLYFQAFRKSDSKWVLCTYDGTFTEERDDLNASVDVGSGVFPFENEYIVAGRKTPQGQLYGFDPSDNTYDPVADPFIALVDNLVIGADVQE